MALSRLHATSVDCAHELINGESGIKGEGWGGGGCWQNSSGKVGEGGKKRNN